jgi:hypothetical protein
VIGGGEEGFNEDDGCRGVSDLRRSAVDTDEVDILLVEVNVDRSGSAY